MSRSLTATAGSDPTVSSGLIAFVELVTVLLLVAALIAAVARRTAVPESIFFVLVGLGVAIAFPMIRLGISADLVLLVLLPGLVFEAAYDLEWRNVRTVLPALLALAVPGVLISAGAVAVALHLATGLPLSLTFVVGAITAATDPVAVTSALRRLAVPERLRTLVEGESLLNDGTGLVLFALALRAAESDLSIGEALGIALLTVLVSVAVGVAGGYVAARLIRLTDEAAIQLTGSIVLAYGTYEIAAALGLSGILATVVSAATLGGLLRRDAAAPAIVRDFDVFWGTLAFVLTSITFLLIGFAIEISGLLSAIGAVLVGTFAIVVARATMIYAPLLILRRRGWIEAPRGWAHVLFWSGLRGAVALAAALSIPSDFPERGLLQDISFGVVLLTLLLQGGTATLVVGKMLGAKAPPVGGAG